MFQVLIELDQIEQDAPFRGLCDVEFAALPKAMGKGEVLKRGAPPSLHSAELCV